MAGMQKQIMDELEKITENTGLKLNIDYNFTNTGKAYVMDGLDSKLSFYFSFQSDTYSLQFYPEGIQPIGTCGFTHEKCILNYHAQYVENFEQLFLFFQNQINKIASNNSRELMAKLTNENIMKIGDGATMPYGSDCYPYTIVGISKSGKRIEIQRDDWKRTDKNGYGGNQEYEYIQDTKGVIEKVSLRKDGLWRTVGGGTRVIVGSRRKYEDPSF